MGLFGSGTETGKPPPRPYYQYATGNIPYLTRTIVTQKNPNMQHMSLSPQGPTQQSIPHHSPYPLIRTPAAASRSRRSAPPSAHDRTTSTSTTPPPPPRIAAARKQAHARSPAPRIATARRITHLTPPRKTTGALYPDMVHRR
jgi:hypothetical protein